MTQSWTYGLCESCLKNSHKESKMVKRTVTSTDSTGSSSEEMWICTTCGFSRKL